MIISKEMREQLEKVAGHKLKTFKGAKVKNTKVIGKFIRDIERAHKQAAHSKLIFKENENGQRQAS